MMFNRNELAKRINDLTYVEQNFEGCISEFHLEEGLTDEIKNGGYSVLCDVAFAYGRLAYIYRFQEDDWEMYVKYLRLTKETYKVLKHKFRSSLKHVKSEADFYYFMVIHLPEMTDSDYQMYVDAKSLYEFYLEKKPQPSPSARKRYEALLAEWGN